MLYFIWSPLLRTYDLHVCDANCLFIIIFKIDFNFHCAKLSQIVLMLRNLFLFIVKAMVRT